jgi:hypothetical protein
MSKVPGFLMILAGVGAAAYVIPTMDAPDHRAEKQFMEPVSISTAAKVPAAEPAMSREMPAAIQQTAAIVAPLAQPSAILTPPAPKPIVLTNSENTSTAPIRRDGVTAKAPDKSRLALTRDIQKELKRVGCYAGEADGEWNAATQQSMRTFIDRVNATLPIDEPDHILKTLVQGHPGDACGKSCPTGQGLSNDGRCLPAAILAKTPKRLVQARRVEPSFATTTASIPVPVTPLAPSQPQRQKIVSSWESTVTPAAPTPSPPGRMAVGAGPSVNAALPSIVTPRAPEANAAPMPPTPVAPRAVENAAKPAIVIKPRPGTAVAKADVKQPELKDLAAKDTPAPVVIPPKIAAVTASEPLDEEPRPREIQQRRPLPPVVSYRPPPPPPRYVGIYGPPPRQVYSQRGSFGPEIFRRLEASGR